MLVFVDESAANERTLDRKYGWAPKGRAARYMCPLQRTKKWSILPAYTMNGFLTYDLVHGSFTAELFIEFLHEKLLPRCTAYPGPRSVLIMDNASIHRDPVHLQILLANPAC